ncbi:hypothetical protein M408DRAFT_218168 [Serendipita vermifera MAFF 305830]|uniref:Uncharacterized protein n=1 Tax=Serendipita vermifera MAFF 305830 TaxID=933852 RepID=A0A0C2X2A9_SERVB|nr:hypothetical protein M408DRAFT_218168 [Serendipita vermifera MAFF 305830]
MSSLLIGSSSPVISRHNNSRTLRINPSKRQLQDSGCDSRDTQQLKERSCVDTEGDLWLVLDLDDWLVTGKDVNQQSTKLAEQMFTLRISSPASVSWYLSRRFSH